MTHTKPPKGTIAIEEAVLDPAGLSWISASAHLFNPGYHATSSATTPPPSPGSTKHGQLTASLLDIHNSRLTQMDAHGVEYMLLSLTSPGPQGNSDLVKAKDIASKANDWLSEQVKLNPARFGGLASLSMHNATDASEEAVRAVRELGFFGIILNDYQDVPPGSEGADHEGKKYYDTEEFRPFWKTVEELDVPVYMHPRYPPDRDLQPGTKWGDRKQILGAAVQFHLDLSTHIYALCSSGVFDLFPKVKLVIGHLGEGIPFNLWRADHWYNKPVKRATRPSKEDYSYYFTHNISITTSGNFNTAALKFCIDQIGVERCLFSIDYPYDTIAEAQYWWHSVDLPDEQKQLVARQNAIKLFKLPLE
ncbi:putative 2,3-dihydroxybenzoic acid decarboxylase [Podospora australis]|uniref:2,3-dihydroxybenzoic acid decarboxylase n=1 Tax=Podospora australis TaxID=1536484 RepID=A0AAN7AJA6_9PEZI|nr:putative 2,3-dihydroxybenzoic acid decarboxylase [Podospora australis]